MFDHAGDDIMGERKGIHVAKPQKKEEIQVEASAEVRCEREGEGGNKIKAINK